MSDCIFCEIVNGNIKARKIYETKYSIAILDAFPLREGHTLIISKSHKTKIQELDINENSDIFSVLHFLITVVENTTNSKASLIAIHNGKDAGQEIPHIHIHIVPVKKSNKHISIHSMFSKEKFSDERLDYFWKKLIANVQSNLKDRRQDLR